MMLGARFIFSRRLREESSEVALCVSGSRNGKVGGQFAFFGLGRFPTQKAQAFSPSEKRTPFQHYGKLDLR